MMLYPAMNDLLKQVPSRYQLVNVVAHRAREIAAEAEEEGYPLEDKPVSIAIREVADGKVTARRCLRRNERERQVPADTALAFCGDRGKAHDRTGAHCTGGALRRDLRHRQAL